MMNDPSTTRPSTCHYRGIGKTDGAPASSVSQTLAEVLKRGTKKCKMLSVDHQGVWEKWELHTSGLHIRNNRGGRLDMKVPGAVERQSISFKHLQFGT